MQEEDGKANKVVDPSEAEGGCSGSEGGGLPRDTQQEPADCLLQRCLEGLLDRVSLRSWGTRLLCTVLGVVSTFIKVASSLACVWLLLSVPKTAQGTDS